MTSKYQVILIGKVSPLSGQIKDVLFHHLDEIGIKQDVVSFIYAKDFSTVYRSNAPTYALYFGNAIGSYEDLDILEKLIYDASLVLPVVEDLTKFGVSIPTSLERINGYQLSSQMDVERLVNNILEGLSLLRLSRRLFISYKRDESSAVAIQLFEELEKRNYDVFLDTHSIRPGETFQDELWHRLSDTDVVVLLNTPGFLKSHWTTEELARANTMSIGILQLIFPNHTLERDARLSIPFQLSDSHFGNPKYMDSIKYLTQGAITEVTDLVESLRARSLASRQNNLITEFIKAAQKQGRKSQLQPEKFILVEKATGKNVILIPTVGVPQAFTYNQSQELVKRLKSKDLEEIWILYDHRNIRERWIEHLAWLDSYLPVKSIKIIDSEKWLKSN